MLMKCGADPPQRSRPSTATVPPSDPPVRPAETSRSLLRGHCLRRNIGDGLWPGDQAKVLPKHNKIDLQTHRGKKKTPCWFLFVVFRCHLFIINE